MYCFKCFLTINQVWLFGIVPMVTCYDWPNLWTDHHIVEHSKAYLLMLFISDITFSQLKMYIFIHVFDLVSMLNCWWSVSDLWVLMVKNLGVFDDGWKWICWMFILQWKVTVSRTVISVYQGTQTHFCWFFKKNTIYL